jgi:hypothetical protein
MSRVLTIFKARRLLNIDHFLDWSIEEGESRLEGGWIGKSEIYKLKHTLQARVSVRNINESEREGENKSQANKSGWHSDLFYRGSVFANLLPVEVVTKTGSLSTLSLS